MTETTLEEAKRCPKCGQPGELVSDRSVNLPNFERGTRIHTFMCNNNRCRWYQTVCRVVQVNPDGSIPPPLLKRDKQFPEVPDMTDAVNAALERQLAAETSKEGTAEVQR